MYRLVSDIWRNFQVLNVYLNIKWCLSRNAGLLWPLFKILYLGRVCHIKRSTSPSLILQCLNPCTSAKEFVSDPNSLCTRDLKVRMSFVKYPSPSPPDNTWVRLNGGSKLLIAASGCKKRIANGRCQPCQPCPQLQFFLPTLPITSLIHFEIWKIFKEGTGTVPVRSVG